MIVFGLGAEFVVNSCIVFSIATGFFICERKRLDGNTKTKSQLDCTVVYIQFLRTSSSSSFRFMPSSIGQGQDTWKISPQCV